MHTQKNQSIRKVYFTTKGIIEDMSPLANWPLVGRPNLFAGRSPISSKPHHRFFGFNLEVPASQRVLLSTFFLTFFLFSSFDLRKKKKEKKKKKKRDVIVNTTAISTSSPTAPHSGEGKRKEKEKKKVRKQKYQTSSVYLSIYLSYLLFPLLLPHYYHNNYYYHHLSYQFPLQFTTRKKKLELIRKGEDRGKHGQHPRQSSGRNSPLARNSLTPNRVRPFWYKRRSRQRPLRPPNRRTRELCARPAGSART